MASLNLRTGFLNALFVCLQRSVGTLNACIVVFGEWGNPSYHRQVRHSPVLAVVHAPMSPMSSTPEAKRFWFYGSPIIQVPATVLPLFRPAGFERPALGGGAAVAAAGVAAADSGRA